MVELPGGDGCDGVVELPGGDGCDGVVELPGGDGYDGVLEPSGGSGCEGPPGPDPGGPDVGGAWHCAVLQSNGAAVAAHCGGGRCAGAPGMQFHLPSAVATAHPGREVKKLSS